MSYVLDPSARLDDEVRRAAAEQLTDAAQRLAAGGSPAQRDEAVHEARKAAKKVRSLLRLVRGAVGRDERRELNGRLRDAAGSLGAIRDAQVLTETLAAVRTDAAGRVPVATLDGIAARVVERRRALRLQAVTGDATGGLRASLAFAGIRDDLGRLALEADGWDALEDGFDRTYRRGRAAAGTDVDTPDGEAFHEWRKRAKDLRYHVEALAGLWPGPLGALEDELHRLTDLLGDEHDLAVLDDLLATDATVTQGLDGVDELRAVLAERRRGLRVAAGGLGRKVYAERPKAFRRRLRAYWEAAAA